MSDCEGMKEAEEMISESSIKYNIKESLLISCVIGSVDRVTGVQVVVALLASLVVVLGWVVLECESELAGDWVEWIVGLHGHFVHCVVVTVVVLHWVELTWRRD